MEQFNNLLPDVLRAAANSNEVVQVAVRVAWNRTVGKSLSRYAIPIVFSEQILRVAVPDMIWKRQLQSMLGQLISKTNAALGQPLIRSVQFIIDVNLLAKAEQERTAITIHPNEAEHLPPDLGDAAEAITDPHLRRLLTGAAKSCLQRLKESGS